MEELLAATNSLINKQPDIFNPETLIIAFRILERKLSNNVDILVFSLLSKACIMHEINRQNIINANIIKYLKPHLSSDDPEVNVHVQR